MAVVEVRHLVKNSTLHEPALRCAFPTEHFPEEMVSLKSSQMVLFQKILSVNTFIMKFERTELGIQWHVTNWVNK